MMARDLSWIACMYALQLWTHPWPHSRGQSSSYVLLPVLLWRDTMVMATCNRKHLIGGLITVSEGEPMTNIVGSMTAGRQAGRQASRQQAQRQPLLWCNRTLNCQLSSPCNSKTNDMFQCHRAYIPITKWRDKNVERKDRTKPRVKPWWWWCTPLIPAHGR